MRIPRRALGRSGIEVSILGLGTGALGETRVAENDAQHLVARALELGVTMFDTARSYGDAEERLGRALAGRRDEVVVVTKGGYGAEGAADWTPDAIRLGIEGALRRLRTDRLDAFLLHSCSMPTLVRDELLVELDRAKEAGKILQRGYSGENEELAWAIRSGRFDVVECSVSVVDRGSLDTLVADAARRGIGVLAKRPLGNAPWRFGSVPDAPDIAEAWRRFRALGIDIDADVALRFGAFAPGVSSALVGTSSVAHLEQAAAAILRGPLDAEISTRLANAWTTHASPEWRGIV